METAVFPVRFFDALHVSADLSAPVDKNAFQKARSVYRGEKTMERFPSFKEFFAVHRILTFVCISGNLFSRADWLAADLSVGRKSGSVQLQASIRILATGKPIFYCLRPIVQYR